MGQGGDMAWSCRASSSGANQGGRRLRVSSPQGYSGKATKPPPWLSKREDLKVGWQSPGFHFKLCTEAAIHPRNSSCSCSRGHKNFTGSRCCSLEVEKSSSAPVPLLTPSCDRVPMLKKKLTAHLSWQKWNILVQQISTEYALPLTDKASFLKLSFYCLFRDWFLFTWVK